MFVAAQYMAWGVTVCLCVKAVCGTLLTTPLLPFYYTRPQLTTQLTLKPEAAGG